jgi:hypothetical protein
MDQERGAGNCTLADFTFSAGYRLDKMAHLKVPALAKRGHPLEVPVKHKISFHSRFSTACWFSFFVDRFYVNPHR